MRTDLVAASRSAERREPRSADADNPVWSDEDLRRGSRARKLRCLRLSLDLSPAEFAARHGLDAAAVTAWEKGREPVEETVLQRLLDAEADLAIAAKQTAPNARF